MSIRPAGFVTCSAIVVVFTGSPRQGRFKRSEEEVERICYDNVVEEVSVKSCHNDTISDTLIVCCFYGFFSNVVDEPLNNGQIRPQVEIAPFRKYCPRANSM